LTLLLSVFDTPGMAVPTISLAAGATAEALAVLTGGGYDSM
jgi:hypothetical protein